MAGTVSSPDDGTGLTGVTPQLSWEDQYPEHPVNELLAQNPGAQSPFGDDISFPLPVEALFYDHPGPESRPNLAGH